MNGQLAYIFIIVIVVSLIFAYPQRLTQMNAIKKALNTKHARSIEKSGLLGVKFIVEGILINIRLDFKGYVHVETTGNFLPFKLHLLKNIVATKMDSFEKKFFLRHANDNSIDICDHYCPNVNR
jgi:hypothetical protein